MTVMLNKNRLADLKAVWGTEGWTAVLLEAISINSWMVRGIIRIECDS